MNYTDPVIIYCAKGKEHIIMLIWSINSLKKFNYFKIEVIVSNLDEANFLKKYFPDIVCTVIDIDIKNYRMWAYRPFALQKYNIKNKCNIVISDTDIIWKKDPRLIFKKFYNQPWVHKITSLDPGEFFDYKNYADVPKRRIGLRTMISYSEYVKINYYPNFHLNCGLFMLDDIIYHKVLHRWVDAIKITPPEKMIMTEALLSMVFAELKISPISDEEDIKYHNLEHRKIKGEVVSYKFNKKKYNKITGYQVATHFFGGLRKHIIKEVINLKLDDFNLYQQYKILIRKKKFYNLLGKIIKIFKN